MDAPDICWSALAPDGEHAQGDEHEDTHAEYDLETMRLAVEQGKHPDGESLSHVCLAGISATRTWPT
jgi:hypothetical protein